MENYKRIVVEGSWSGDVLPGRLDELRRTVTIRPGSHVTGAVFGHEVRIEGPCSIQKAVYATKEVILEPAGRIRLMSSLGAREIVSCSSNGERAYVDGDLVTRVAHLSNVIIRGNLHVDEARITNSIILGVVTATRSLILNRSIVLTASASSIVFGEGCGLLLPHAEAESISIAGSVHLPLLGPAPDGILSEQDIVNRDGRKWLGAGRRLSNMAKAARFIEASRNLVTKETIGDALSASYRGVDSALIAPALHPLLESAI